MCNKALFIFSLCLLAGFPQAGAEVQLPSHPDQYYGDFDNKSKQQSFKDKLHHILASSHIIQKNGNDQLVENCSKQNSGNCYSHQQLSYRRARQFLFGYLFLQENGKTSYSIPSVYCDTTLTSDEFPSKHSLGPMKIPDSQVINAEHSWPQSQFTTNFPKSLQKSDLHALYPVRMHVNSTRGSFPYGEVIKVQQQPCSQAALGLNQKGQKVFEPAEDIKGNIARSLLYFSVRYRTSIGAVEEAVLRQWHKQDPVDQAEIDKHEEVFQIQQDRNPFVDHPEWVDRVSDF